MSSRVRAVLVWLVSQTPTLLVLGRLAGVGYFGHHHEWKIPPFAKLWKEDEKEPTKKQDDDDDKKDPASIVLGSAEGAGHAGLEHAPAEEKSLDQYVDAPAVLAFDHDLYAQLAPRASGPAWRVLRGIGAPVKKGDLLALIAADTVGTAKAEFLNAHIQHEIRLKTLQRLQTAGDSIPERQLREAELSLREGKVRLVNAQQALVNLGLPLRLEDLRGLTDEQIARKVQMLGLPSYLASEEDLPSNLLPMVAPFDGLVIRRDIVVGEVVSPRLPVYWIGDVRQLHVEIDVRLEDVARLAPGQTITFRSNTASQVATGKLKWVSAEVDAKTRTVRAHAEIENPYGPTPPARAFRPATFGRAQILVSRTNLVLTVPDSAVQWDGNSYRVFVRINDKTYDPRVALQGMRAGGRTELLDTRSLWAASLAGGFASPAGPLSALVSLPATRGMLLHVRKGEEIVTTGSHVLKSELLKSRIGSED